MVKSFCSLKCVVFSWNWFYYPHMSRDSVSPVCGIFLVVYTTEKALSLSKIHLSAIPYCTKGTHTPGSLLLARAQAIATGSKGLAEENTQLGILSPIGYFKSPIGDFLSNWGLVIFSLTLRYQTHVSPIPNRKYYSRLGI